MQDMRYLNLFNKITNMNTRYFFKYNEMLVFAVPKNLVKRALGKDAENIREIGKTLRKKIRIVPIPEGTEDAKDFFEKIVDPVSFKDIEIKNDEIIITAGNMNKAALIGRNKRRLMELQKISRDFFERDLRIA